LEELQQQFGEMDPALGPEAGHESLKVGAGGVKYHLIEQARDEGLHGSL